MPAPTFQMNGTPSSKMKKAIKASIEIDEKATRRKPFSNILSLVIFHREDPFVESAFVFILTNPSWTSSFCPCGLRI